MSHDTVRGVVVITRAGDHIGYEQNPINYKSGPTECTPLGEVLSLHLHQLPINAYEYPHSATCPQVQSFDLGSNLRERYFDPSSPDVIRDVRHDLVELDKVHVRVKNGGEGRVVFDSALAMLQGLFPPTEKNRIELANEQVITAPLGGYQYVPGEKSFAYVQE